MKKPLPKPRAEAYSKGRVVLFPEEVASQLACHVDHVYDLIESGDLKAIDISGRNNLTGRRCCRVPVEAFADFMKRRSQ